MRIHMVKNDIMGQLGYSSKLNAEWDFISMLHREGRRAATEFLEACGDDIGRRSTVDLDALLEGV
jgi:NTE family protein